MASKIRKSKPFNAVKAVKSNARDRVGEPKPSQVIVPKSKKEPRFKDDWNNYIDEEFANLKEDLEKL